MNENAIFIDCIARLSELTYDHEPIELTNRDRCELLILIRGGCTVSDLEEGIDAWLLTRAPVHPHEWGYIRAVMLRSRARFMEREWEAATRREA